MALRFRALEMHGQRMWERDRVLKTLAFMQQHDMNALVLHESDLVHQIVYPRAYFDPYALWSDLPSRRGENAIFNKRAYFDHLLKLAAAAEKDDLQAITNTLEQLEAYAARARSVAEDSRIPHQVVMLIDYRRALDIIREGREAESKVSFRPGADHDTFHGRV